MLVGQRNGVPRSKPETKSKAKHYSSKQRFQNKPFFFFSFLVGSVRFYSCSGIRVVRRWNQACKRSVVLDPNSPFRQRTEEKTDEVVCWGKQSPRCNQILCSVWRLPLFCLWCGRNVAIIKHLQKLLHLFLLKLTEPRGQCACSPLVCREHDVADAIPSSSTPARSHWSAARCSENSEINYQCEHVLIDQITCFFSLFAPNCTSVHLHTQINMHTCVHIYRHRQMGY